MNVVEERNQVTMMAMKVHHSKKTLQAIKREYKKYLILEEECTKELSLFFKKLEKEIHEIIDEYWDSELGLFHLNKISDLITLRKQDYYDILFKYCKIQYDRSRNRTERIYNRQLRTMSIKSNIDITTLSSLFQTDPTITYNLNNKIFVASDHTLSRVDDLVMSNLSQSYDEGLGIDEAKKRLTVKYNGLKTWEASRIARTEINSAQNDACFDMYNELGCEYHQWWTAQDERVRDGRRGTADHAILHGKIVRVGTRFSNGLLYPGDRQGSIKEWINCRCTTIPYLIPLGKMVPPGLTEFTEYDLIDIPGWKTPKLDDLLKNISNNVVNNVPKKAPKKVPKTPKIKKTELKKDAKRLLELQLKVDKEFDYDKRETILKEIEELEGKFLKNNLKPEDYYDYKDISKQLYKLKLKLNQVGERSSYSIEDDIETLEYLLESKGINYEDYLTKTIKKSLEKETLKEIDLDWYKNNYLKQFGRKYKELNRLESIEKTYPTETNKILQEIIPLNNQNKLLSKKDRRVYDALLDELESQHKKYPNKSNEEILGAYYKEFKRLEDIVKNPDFIVNMEHNYNLPEIAGRNYRGFVNESYRVVKFKKYDFEVWVGEGCDVSTKQLIETLDSIPKSLLNQNNNKVIVSSSKNVFSKRTKQYIGGFCAPDNEIVMVMGDTFERKEFMRVLPHECGHAWDNNLGGITSYARDYYNIAESEGRFVTSYARKGYENFGTYYAEDFAEAIGAYVNRPSHLKRKFPKRYEYIKNLFEKEDRYSSVRDLLNKEKYNQIGISESKKKKVIHEIAEDILEDGKINKRTKSKLEEYWDKEFKKIELENQSKAERIFLLRNQLDKGGLSKAEIYSKNKELKTLVNKFNKEGLKWQDSLTKESITKVNKKLGIPANHTVKVWTEDQLKINLVKAFEDEIPKSDSLYIRKLKDLKEADTPKSKSLYRNLKYLKESYDYLIKKGIDYNKLADDDVVKELKRQGIGGYGILGDIDDLRYYRHAYDETKFLSLEKEKDWTNTVKRWKRAGVDIESLSDLTPITAEEKKRWEFDIKVYRSKIPDELKEKVEHHQLELKVEKYKKQLYKTEVKPEAKINRKNTSLKTALSNDKALNDNQLEEFSDYLYGVDYDEVIGLLDDVGLKFKDTSKLKVHRFEDIDKWGLKVTSPTSAFNKYERKGMRRYSGDDHDRMDNYYKRGFVTEALDDFEEFNEDINWLVEGLDKGTNNTNMVLYKGSEKSWAGPVGTINTMGKFQSTSIHPIVTNNFGTHKTVFIAPKKSVKGTYLNGVSKHSEELEVLLSPHQKYQTLYDDELITVVKLLI